MDKKVLEHLYWDKEFTLREIADYFGLKNHKTISYHIRQYRVAGYFLDGYCPALNLAIEVDEPYHKTKEMLDKDAVRQKNIEAELECKFLRLQSFSPNSLHVVSPNLPGVNDGKK